MESTSGVLAERMRGLPNEELKSMLEIGLKEYTEEALTAALAELERRGKAGGVKPVPDSAPLEMPVPGVAALAVKKKGVWGAILVVIGAFFVYFTVLFSMAAIVASNAGRKVPTQIIFQILFGLVLMFICLRAGSRRRRNWQTLLGICLLIFGGLLLASSSVLARRPNSLAKEVMVPTAIILAVAGIVALLFGHIRRTYNK
jgi:hypothetical protein